MPLRLSSMTSFLRIDVIRQPTDIEIGHCLKILKIPYIAKLRTIDILTNYYLLNCRIVILISQKGLFGIISEAYQ